MGVMNQLITGGPHIADLASFAIIAIPSPLD